MEGTGRYRLDRRPTTRGHRHHEWEQAVHAQKAALREASLKVMQGWGRKGKTKYKVFLSKCMAFAIRGRGVLRDYGGLRESRATQNPDSFLKPLAEST